MSGLSRGKKGLTWTSPAVARTNPVGPEEKPRLTRTSPAVGPGTIFAYGPN
jgi:hypothetical protein